MKLRYQDINNHDPLRYDPSLAAAWGCEDILGEDRHRKAARRKALTAKSTLNRMKLTPNGPRRSARYKRKVAERSTIGPNKDFRSLSYPMPIPGTPGDGVITVCQINEMIRIRTGERCVHIV